MSSGQTFKQMRKRVGLTQRQVAEALKITDQTVSNWESNRVEPKLTIHQTQTLCQVLQCGLEDLPNFLDVANS